MDKNIIKNHLTQRFLSEESTPGIKVTAAVKKESGKNNKEGVKAIEKEVGKYDKNMKTDPNSKEMADNKFNYNGDKEKQYHDEMEIMNGQEMNQYDREPSDIFKERAMEAIEGSTRMGNNPEWANVVAKGQGGDPEFGKNLVKKIKASEKKRAEQTPTTKMYGNDWEVTPDEGHKSYAIKENNNNPQIKESMKRLKFKKEFNGVGNALKLIPESYRTNDKEFEMTDGNETYRIRWEGTLTEGRAVVLTASDKKMVNEDMQHMKHLMGYKPQETLGLLKGNARLDENAAFSNIYNKTKVLLEGEDIESAKAKTGNLEDIKKKSPEATKHVEGSVSKDKGTQAPAPKTGDLDDAVNHAPEAKEHVEGSVSTEKGTKAPAPKKGEWENVKKKATEATKHVTMKESFEADEDETKEHEDSESAEFEAGEKEETSEMTTESTGSADLGGVAPAPKKGEWEKIKVPHAAEAKKHIHMGTESTANQETVAKVVSEGLKIGNMYFAPMNEGLDMSDVYYVAISDMDEPGVADARLVSPEEYDEYVQNRWDLRGPFSELSANKYLEKINQSNRNYTHYDSMDDREGISNLQIDPLDKFERDSIDTNW